VQAGRRLYQSILSRLSLFFEEPARLLKSRVLERFKDIYKKKKTKP
jgi:hypothetical protein